MSILPEIRTHEESTAFKTFYPKIFRRDAHTLVALGYRGVRSTINADTHEPTITIRIAVWIKQALNRLDLLPNRMLACRYNVSSEQPLIETLDPASISDGHRYLDIVVEDSQSMPRQEILFEAKRLKQPDFSVKKYCDEGVARFVTDIYPALRGEAVMVAFCQTGTASGWQRLLSKHFNNSKKSASLNIEKHLREVRIINDFPNEWMSRHHRPSGKALLLFHVFLECT